MIIISGIQSSYSYENLITSSHSQFKKRLRGLADRLLIVEGETNIKPTPDLQLKGTLLPLDTGSQEYVHTIANLESQEKNPKLVRDTLNVVESIDLSNNVVSDEADAINSSIFLPLFIP